jgi:hypothetical protein
MTAGWGRPKPDARITRSPTSVNEVKFAHGAGTDTSGDLLVNPLNAANRFTAVLGADNTGVFRARMEFGAVNSLIYYKRNLIDFARR